MITSIQNPKIQKIRSLLAQAKERKRSNQFVIDGVRLCEEAMAANWEFETILISENLSDRGQSLLNWAYEQKISIEHIPVSLMKKISDTENPQGILGVVNQKQHNLPEPLDFILICDSIKDPGNLGTILRTADAARVQAVLLSPNCVDVFSPKVVRAGMGAHFHIPIKPSNWEEISAFCKNPAHPLKTFIASADAKSSLWQVDLTQPIAIIIGSEATGPGLEANQIANEKIRIPMPGSSESLNAAIAASIILFEVIRQRWK